jgi:hypothetical protein
VLVPRKSRQRSGVCEGKASRLIRDVESSPTWRDLGRTESPVYDPDYFAKIDAKEEAAKAEPDCDMKKFLEAAKDIDYSVWFKEEEHFDRLKLAFKTYGLEAIVAAFRKFDSEIEADWLRPADVFTADMGKWVEGVHQEEPGAGVAATG